MNESLPGVMPLLEKGGAGAADFDPLAVARSLLRGHSLGALGTLDRHRGFPMVTLTTVGLAMDGAPVFLLSKLASHTANLDADPRASLLLSETGKGDPLAHPRLTVFGEARRVSDETEEALLRAFFLARHPKSKLYAGFGDFGFFRLEPVSAHLNGGFARAADLDGRDLLVDLTGAEHLKAAAASALEHMNENHRDALQTLAAHHGATPGRWRMTGVDPEGCDLMDGTQVLRLPFATRVTGGEALHNILVTMLNTAKHKSI